MLIVAYFQNRCKERGTWGGMKAREMEESDGMRGGRKWRQKEARCLGV